MKKGRIIFWIKLVVMLAVAAAVAYALHDAWTKVRLKHIAIEWRWGGVAVAGFCASMLTSGFVWRALAARMGDRSPTLPLIGAYTFSQVGKYIPGKVALLLMRIERAGRFGMNAGTCTLSTLLENALYMISGGLAGMMAIVKLGEALPPRQRVLLWPVTIAAVAILATGCAPPLFYRGVNQLLRKFKRPEVPRQEWLGVGSLVLGVLGFLPCWIFGGISLWASVCCVHPLSLGESWWFAGAYALSVIIGMASLLPGGTGVRDALLLAAVTIALTPAMGIDAATLTAGVVALLQRLFQVVAELLLGLAGAAITSRRNVAEEHQAERAPESSS